MRRSTLLLVVAASLALACSSKSSGGDASQSGNQATCTPAEIPTSYTDEPFDTLSQYCLFDVTKEALAPRKGVEPYDVNSALFSDYAVKLRTIWMPAGTSATYADDDPFEFPVGTIISKTFSLPDDRRKDQPSLDRVETRLLIRGKDGWNAVTYLWREDEGDADLFVAGEVVPKTLVDVDGTTLDARYLVPSTNECKKCHEDADKIIHPIGLRARHVNRDYAYSTGTENQIAHLARVGYLTGAPSPEQAPKLPVWNDPSTGTVDQRARAWLEINCAHCHNPKGPARTTGLTLTEAETDAYKLDICKPPVAAGKATGGFSYDIVPGSPDTSILMFRISSTQPDLQMPELGRSLVATDAVALVREWIMGMDGPCTANGTSGP